MGISCAHHARIVRALSGTQYGIGTSEEKIGVKSSNERPKCVNMRSFTTVVKDLCCVGTKLWDPSRSRSVVRALMRGFVRGLMRGLMRGGNEREWK